MELSWARENARSAAYGEWAARDFLRRAITKPAEVPDLQSESVAALGQALPFKSGTFDGAVSVFGVLELRLGDKLSPEDGGVVTDALHELATCNYQIYINDNPSARVNQAGGVMRVIELTKRQPE